MTPTACHSSHSYNLLKRCSRSHGLLGGGVKYAFSPRQIWMQLKALLRITSSEGVGFSLVYFSDARAICGALASRSARVGSAAGEGVGAWAVLTPPWEGTRAKAGDQASLPGLPVLRLTLSSCSGGWEVLELSCQISEPQLTIANLEREVATNNAPFLQCDSTVSLLSVTGLCHSMKTRAITPPPPAQLLGAKTKGKYMCRFTRTRDCK